MIFAFVAVLVAIVGAVMAALTGAGVGSTLVPFFSLHVDFKVAVAAAALPHLAGSAMRTAELWRDVDRRLLLRFGVLCALGSLIGALLHARIATQAVTLLFSGLLILAGSLGLLGLSEKVRLPATASWIVGAVSGLFGGLAGEQGGLRAVALLGFELRKDAFVATATAIAVAVDVVRAPVYLFSQWQSLRPMAGIVAVSCVAVLAGTWLGGRVRQRVPESLFRKLVSGVILGIGALLALQARH